MPSAPWDGAAAEDQLFVLVTGANSGIGLGIGQRLIDEFAALHPSPQAHLVLITTTRSAAKSRQTTDVLGRYLQKQEAAARSSRHATLHPARIHLASIELDLCNLPSVHAAAERLREEPLAIYSGGESASSAPARVPRLDSVIFNAGIGGWTGVGWSNLLTGVLFGGILQEMTYPTCKAAQGGLLVDPLTGREVRRGAASPYEDEGSGVMGQVFCANLFGHYVFAHALLPLLSGTGSGGGSPARIVWESSIESVCWRHLSLDDFQGVRVDAAYESSKRLTDVLSLTAGLPGVAPFSAPFFKDDDAKEGTAAAVAPASYVTHPGVVCSTLFPLPWYLFHLYYFAMCLARWLGSPWHPVTGYKGAAAAVWLALQPQPALDALDARRVKWGSSTTRGGRALVKRTEVEGWGWRGRVGEEGLLDAAADALANPAVSPGSPSPACLRNSVGRRRDTVDVTAERRQEFEALGRDCWREMERLRVEWAARVSKAAAGGKQ